MIQLQSLLGLSLDPLTRRGGLEIVVWTRSYAAEACSLDGPWSLGTQTPNGWERGNKKPWGDRRSAHGGPGGPRGISALSTVP